MADDLSASVEDYLVGLASSLQQAQRQLATLTVPGDGSRPAVAYQLPKLDFELKLSLELSEASSAGGARAGGAGAGNGVALRGRLLNPSGSHARSAEAASTIRGTFVAVPLDGGKPPPVLTTALARIAPDQHRITVRLATATGEPLVGVAVHYNTDRRLAATLNRAFESTPLTRPRRAVVPTEADGTARNEVFTSEDEPGMRVPVVIDALGRSTTIVFVVEGATADD